MDFETLDKFLMQNHKFVRIRLCYSVCFKNLQDELIEAVESLRRENKNLAQEVKDLTDQLGESSRSVHELQKIAKRLEMEKEEMQVHLLFSLRYFDFRYFEKI